MSPLSFHTRVTRIETASPLSDSMQRYVCGPAPPTPELANVSTHGYSLCVWYTFSCMILQKKIVSRI